MAISYGDSHPSLHVPPDIMLRFEAFCIPTFEFVFRIAQGESRYSK